MSIRSMPTIKLLSIDQVFIKRFFSHLLLDSDILENIVTWSSFYKEILFSFTTRFRYFRKYSYLILSIWKRVAESSLNKMCITQKGPLSDDKGVTDQIYLTEKLTNKLWKSLRDCSYTKYRLGSLLIKSCSCF